MLFEKFASAELDAGWTAIQQAVHASMEQPVAAIEFLENLYDSLDDLQTKLYLFSPQIVLRIDSQNALDAAVLCETPRLPDHRQGLEEGLRGLLGWLVNQERISEAQGWAQLSRCLLDNLDDLSYLDRGAQLSLFCIGDRTSRFYLNLQPLGRKARLELLKHFDPSGLYEKALTLSELEGLSLGGVGFEVKSVGFRTKFYVRGRLAALRRGVREGFKNVVLPSLEQFDSKGFIHDAMDAEIALEMSPNGQLRQKWVYFVDEPARGARCIEHWLSASAYKDKAFELMEILGGEKCLFALGSELETGSTHPSRVNVYLRRARAG